MRADSEGGLMRQVPGWPLLAVVAVMVTAVAVTVFKTPEIDNVIAWLFIGGALILIGAWATLIIQAHTQDPRPKVRRVDDE